MAWIIMLRTQVERYLALRRALGFKLYEVSKNLRAFAEFAADKGDIHIRISTAIDWAARSSSPRMRHLRLQNVAQLARFLSAEDQTHEIPPNCFYVRQKRTLPYIYSQEEIVKLVGAAKSLSSTYLLRQEIYATMFGLISATGLRISEALSLRIGDILPNGILHIRCTKFGKSRFIPLHPTVVKALNEYLEARRLLPVTDDHLFLSAENGRISLSTAEYNFRRMRLLSGITPQGKGARQPRIHDFRHSVATRALEQCSTNRDAVSRHFVALATYMGHSDIAHTYWYLEATPQLMINIATAAETFMAKETI
jgi:integrase/recombinase XerD